MEGCFPSSDLPGTSLQPSSHSASAVWENLKEALTSRVEAGCGTPSPACLFQEGSEGPSRSLSSCLVIAETRLMSGHRGHIKGLSLAPRPKQVPALGTTPGLAPSRSRSSCWDQPGRILAFESLILLGEEQVRGCSPSQGPKTGVPSHVLGGMWRQ